MRDETKADGRTPEHDIRRCSRGRDRSPRAWPTRGSTIPRARAIAGRGVRRDGPRRRRADATTTAALATTEFVQPALLACDVAAFRVLEAEGRLGRRCRGTLARRVRGAGGGRRRVARRRPRSRGGARRGDAARRRGATGRDDGAPRRRRRRRRGAVRRGSATTTCSSSRTRTRRRRSVISGSVPAIERAEALAKERKMRAVRLPVAGAFHSPLMEPARAAIDERIDAIAFSPPRCPGRRERHRRARLRPGRAPVAPAPTRRLARAVGVVDPRARRCGGRRRSSRPGPATCSRS